MPVAVSFLAESRLLKSLFAFLPVFCCWADALQYEGNVVVETLAGAQFMGHVDGQGAETMFTLPHAVGVLRNKTAIVGTVGRLRWVSPEGRVTTPPEWRFDLSGTPSAPPIEAISLIAVSSRDEVIGVSKDRLFRFTIGSPGQLVQWVGLDRLGMISGAAFDRDDNLWLVGADQIKQLGTDGVLRVKIGSGDSSQGMVDGKGFFSGLRAASQLAIDPSGTMYFADDGIFLRRVSPDGTVSTLAGKRDRVNQALDGNLENVMFRGIGALACDSVGNVFMVDGAGIRVYRPSGRVTTIAGSPNSQTDEYIDGDGRTARFGRGGMGLAVVDDKTLLVTQTQYQRVRRIRLDAAIPIEEGAKVEIFAGVTVSGPVGARYRIEARNDVDSTSSWRAVADITTSTTPFTWIDPGSPQNRFRFYRAVRIP